VIKINSLFLYLTIFVPGGIKAVLATDVFFALIMFIGQVVILVHALMFKIGDLSDAYRNFTDQFQEEYQSTFDPTEVYAFWDLFIGVTVMCLFLYGANHASVLRIISAKNDQTATYSAWIVCVGLTVILIIGLGFGFVLKVFYTVHPRPENVRNDQLLMKFIFDEYNQLPILRGLFIGALVAAALSTSSSMIVSIVDTLHYDMKGLGFGRILQPKLVPRALSVVVGVISAALSLLAARLGKTILTLAFANFGVCGGPFLGLVLCAFCSFTTAHSAIFGTVCSLCICAFGGFGGVLFPGFKIFGSSLWWSPIGASITILLAWIIGKSNPAIQIDNQIEKPELQKLNDI